MADNLLNPRFPADSGAGGPEPLDLRVEKVVTGGDGLAFHEGQAVFVPLTAPGDLVQARIVDRSRGYLRAEALTILEPGPGRRPAPCPHYGECGGCDLQHLSYRHQQAAKTEIVAECFQRLGKMDIGGLLEGPGPGAEFGYRNRIRLFTSPTGHYGLMRRGSHDVVPLQTCPLMCDPFDRDILPWLRLLPPVEQIVLRLNGQPGDRSQWLVSLFGAPARLKVLKRIIGGLPAGEAPAPGCAGLLFNNRPLWGRDHLLYAVAGHTLRAGVQSFFQGNLAATEQAVSTVRSWLEELAAAGDLGPLLGDLFCGVGLFSLNLADMFSAVVAIDSDEGACRDAINNVRRDRIADGKVTVRSGPLGSTLGKAESASPEAWRQGVCLVDPPRTGLGKEGLAAVLKAAPRHLVYLSCNPATLARDAARFVQHGYEPLKAQVLDMFPQTSHIETLLLLARRAS